MLRRGWKCASCGESLFIWLAAADGFICGRAGCELGSVRLQFPHRLDLEAQTFEAGGGYNRVVGADGLSTSL